MSLMSKVKRDSLAILVDILRAVRDSNSAKKMFIVYKANLNYERVKGYLDFSVSCGLVEIVDGPEDKIYRITNKGRDFILSYAHLIDSLKVSSSHSTTYMITVTM